MPKGITSIEDIPWDLTCALRHADQILDWHENLPEDELPPEWMWRFDAELNDWFDQVKEKRDEKYGSRSDDREQVPLMDNEYTAGLRKELAAP